MRFLLLALLLVAAEAQGQIRERVRLADELMYPTNPPRYVIERKVGPRLEVKPSIYPGQTLAREEVIEKQIETLRALGSAADHPLVRELESKLGVLKSERYAALRSSERTLSALKDQRQKADSPEKVRELDEIILRVQKRIESMSRFEGGNGGYS